MSNYTIHTGLWVNYDSAPALGATLTVSIRWGNYLIAALSSLVGWAGASAWSIVSFYLHQRLAAAREKDVLHQQLQVHFRTAGSFLDSWLDGIGLHKAWKGRAEKVKRRTLAVSFLALVLFALFMAAGVFVAEVATKTYQDVLVLAKPSDCGDLSFMMDESDPDKLAGGIDELTSWYNNGAFWGRNYARDVYVERRGRESGFSMSELPFIGHETPCPYTNGTTCLGPNRTEGAAWRMDAGPLDSHIHFGMNAPADERVTWGVTATCAVVDTQNLTTKPYWRLEENDDGTTMNNTYIGILQQFDEDRGEASNLMFEVPLYLKYQRTGYRSQRGLWTPGLNDAYNKSITGYPFNNTEADMAMVSTTQGRMFYYDRVDDPYFMAHRSNTSEEYAMSPNATVYYASQLVTVMVCTEQQQICNPHTDQCTPWSGTLKLQGAIGNNTISLNHAQLATALRLIASVSSMISQTARAATNLMVAEKNGVRGGASLPPNQWIKEVELWFAANLANTQANLLEWIAKPWPAGQVQNYYKYINLTAMDAPYQRANIMEQKDRLCQNQLVRSSTTVQNFSVLALTIVIVFCSALIITALVMPACVGHFRERRRSRGLTLSEAAEAGRVARLADAKYNVLAMALRGAGVENWERRGTSEIPVTKGSVTVCPPVEKNGLPAYPCTSCAICRVPSSSSSSSDSVSDTEKKQKPKLKIDIKSMSGSTVDGDEKRQNSGSKSFIQKLGRSMTEHTLVASPVEMSPTGDDKSSIAEGDRITSLSPAPPIPKKSRTRSQ
ncbi:hypothetical protein QBC37DRAFT_51808 [Rhypophila decipiens]|uniref:Uncharacterized protein n=1 Tax=Rhypophila decipiens TaxID=261697 RepID=A0AAN6YJH0_9PEZI|nr:hypothetical protein QBC37DRAFT_51808 [Rhypophila decipiens]